MVLVGIQHGAPTKTKNPPSNFHPLETKTLTLKREWTEFVRCSPGHTGSVGVRNETMCELMCVGADICENE